MATTMSASTTRQVLAGNRMCASLRPGPVAAPFAATHRAVARRAPVAVRAQAVEAPPAKKTPSYVSTSETYAIIDIGGSQQLVEEGRWYTCNRLQAEPGSSISFGRVLALKNDGEFTVGRPYLDNVTVEAEIIEELKGPKVLVYKMKAKKHTRSKNGHRQPLTKFMVTKISQE